MSATKSNNPLYGLKLEQLLTEISDHYGWQLLSEALQINRFQFHTGMKSTAKFLRVNEWARIKVENFYLYQYKHFPYPDDKQLAIPPRDRHIPLEQLQQGTEPAEITAEVIAQIERLSDDGMLGVANKSEKQQQEPPYDPSNPWNQ
ncbi:VF530 family protein [Psychromonas sp. MME2]|uniref:VF530 family protein n=1 Tax=unclassified Psychromonas TaxID=2614957 RepID=UPI00339C2197